MPSGARDQLLELIEDEGNGDMAQTILICAVNDNVKKSLLDAYISRFSVHIDLPPLHNRRMEERFALVQRFFIEEAMHMSVLSIKKPRNCIYLSMISRRLCAKASYTTRITMTRWRI